MQILMIDNYDSFTYNLVQILESFSGVSVTVKRNDKLTLNEVSTFEKIVLSPGPGIPSEAGIMMEIVRNFAETKSILGVCLGHQCIGEVFDSSSFSLCTSSNTSSPSERARLPSFLTSAGLRAAAIRSTTSAPTDFASIT